MPHFLHKQKNYFLTTNHKVMSSHLAIHPDLTQRTWYSVLPNSIWRVSFRQMGKQHFLIVRNPFSRLESFYRSKLKAVSTYTDLPRGWQNCQQIIIKQLGLSIDQPFEEVKQALSQLSFSSFIQMLPSIYKKDSHLKPQSDKIYVSNMYDRILKLEDPKDMIFLEEKLGIDTRKKTGESIQFQNQEISWTEDDRQIVRKLYHYDFRFFEYE